MHKPIAILYHGGCPDGFGAAYDAWKKFGDGADYVPVKYQQPTPRHLDGKEIYMLDFCYGKSQMDELQKIAGSLTVLDHHEGVKEVVEALPQHLYDPSRSGATIAWSFFHPKTSIPTFLQYVEDADLYRMVPAEERAMLTYAYAQPFHFETWDEIVAKVENPTERTEMAGRGVAYQEYFQLIVKQMADSAELVTFEGYTCYIVGAEKMFITDLGAKLREKQPPFALVVRAGATGLRVSLRGDGSVDVAKLAQKYGGNGHPKSAAFSLPWGTPIPWQPVEQK